MKASGRKVVRRRKQFRSEKEDEEKMKDPETNPIFMCIWPIGTSCHCLQLYTQFSFFYSLMAFFAAIGFNPPQMINFLKGEAVFLFESSLYKHFGYFILFLASLVNTYGLFRYKSKIVRLFIRFLSGQGLLILYFAIKDFLDNGFPTSVLIIAYNICLTAVATYLIGYWIGIGFKVVKYLSEMERLMAEEAQRQKYEELEKLLGTI